MSTIHLDSYRAVCWRPGKAGFVDVVGAVPVTEVPQKTFPERDAVASAPVALECVKQPEQDLVVWLGRKGLKEFKKSRKDLHKVLHACKTATHSGFFFTHHKGERLGFALITHDPHDPRKLTSKPVLYKDELSSLMASVLHDEVENKTGKQVMKRQLVTVRQAVLRETLEGHVLAAVLINRRGAVYAVVANLTRNVWRKWRVEPAIGFMPCIHVHSSGCDVRLVHCDIDAPPEHTCAVAAPSLSLALSTFDRVLAANVTPTAQVASATPPFLCVTFRELILPTSGTNAAAERSFQSQCIERESGDVCVMPRPCFVQVDEETAVYTVVVSYGAASCLAHLCYSQGGSELLTSCVLVPGLQRPISACTVTIQHRHRPRGARVSLVLCDDMRIHCCEHFGQPATVSLSIDDVDCATLKLPVVVTGGKSSKEVMLGETLPPRLISFHNQREILCTNGVVGLFLRVTSASFCEMIPGPAGVVVDGAGDATGYGVIGETSVGAAALRQCLQSLQKLSMSTNHHNLPVVVFRDIMPLLRYVGTSQQEVMMVQRVYQQLLWMAEPDVEAEWSFLWALTSVVQQALVKRGRDNQLQYTDAFFLQLAEAYRNSKFPTRSEEALVGDGLRAVLSAEAQGVIAAPGATLSAESSFLLDGLAAGVPPVALAEEISRRMVRTETLLNGTCSVASQAGVADCVHCIGSVLLASCLDLSVFVFADDAHGLRLSLKQPQDGVCVAVKPYTFLNQEDFETALVFAGDLLCVPSADGSFRPDLALLTLGIGGRQQCLATFLQLFASALRQAVDALMPLSSNRTWFENCVAVLAQSSTEWAASLLCQSSSDSFTLTATLCHLLRPTQRDVDAKYFGSLSRTLSEEFCTTALVAVLFHQTERLLAATQNYASALAAYVLSHKDGVKQGASLQPTDVGRRRLEVALAQTSALWAQVDILSPYRVRDVAESYRISAGNSLASAAAVASASAEGTMVSRTLVLCFRIFCLVRYSLSAEENMSVPLSSKWAGETTDEAFVKDFLGALEVLYLMSGSPFPLEWFQWKFTSRVRSAASLKPTWAPYLARLLQLSNIRQSNSASLKREFYILMDTLQSRSAPSATLAAEDGMQKALAAAESAVTAVALHAEPFEASTLTQGGTAAVSSAPTVSFIFSHQRDTSLPRWTHTHSLEERRYLLSTTWTEALWTLERVPGFLHSACAAALDWVHRADSEVAVKGDAGDYPPPLSEELALPLYAHLCRLRPPVRMHVVTDSASVVDGSAGGGLQRRAGHVMKHEEARQETTSTPEKLAAPLQQEKPFVALAHAVDTTTPAPLLSSGGDPREDLRTDYRRPMPKVQASGEANTGSPASAASAPGTPARGGLYSPADVAWWDTLGTTQSHHRALGVMRACATPMVTSPASAEDNGESSDSATTYTTLTSNYADPLATPESFQKRFYSKGCSHTAAESLGCSCRYSKSRLCRRSSTPAGSPALNEARKKCRCCRRVMHIDRRDCSVGRRERVADNTMPIRVQWSDTAREITATHALSPPVAARPLTADTARPRLLTFTSRLKPPEDPPTFCAQPARAVPTTPSCAATPLSLLTFSSTSKGKESSRVRLYTLDGEHIRYGDGQEMVSPGFTSRPGAGASAGTVLEVPPLPATSVYAAPQPLPSLEPDAAAVQHEYIERQAPHVSVPAHSASVAEVGRSYPQVQRVPAGAAPPAVDAATLQTLATSSPVQDGSVDETALAPAGTAAPVATLPAPPALEQVASLPPPATPPAAVPSALSSTQISDFRRYTDDLLARHNAATPVHASPTASVPVAAALTLDCPSVTPTVTTAGDASGIVRLLQQQDDFIRKAEAILETRQAESEGFYRRVVESIRGLASASQNPRGLSPVEQSQLVQNTVKQRNELMTLNHQLLELQVSAARLTGEAPPVSTASAAGHHATPPRVTFTDATQTQPQQRESVGVSWGREAHGPAVSTTASTTAVPPSAKSTLAHAGIRETLSDLQRLNTELVAVNMSAEAMDKAIKETREVIQRYERNKTAEALTSEGIALTSAMRLRTAAVEQRLAALPPPVERAAAPDVKKSSSVWVSQESVGETVEDQLLAPASATLSPSPHSAAQANPSSVTAGEGLSLWDKTQCIPSSGPPEAEPLSTSVPQTTGPTQPERLLSPTGEVSTAPVDATAAPPASASFISVMSTSLGEEAEEQSVTWKTTSPPSPRCNARQSCGGEAPSLHDRETMRHSTFDFQRAMPHKSATRVTTEPRDLGSLFLEAGGRYVIPRNGSAASPRRKTAAAPPLHNSQGGSSPLKVDAARRRLSPSENASTRQPRRVHEERYAMYRATSKPAKVQPVVAAKLGARVSCVPPPPPPRRVLTGDMFVDRHRSRRMASIAQRMHQLEQDLFT
ncbi:hypothetical protein JKF63_07306 [Porcisia hertigi]|uniref:Uncharacterized protein n=1 Tax=Porcisia hertigi TaxID=2761500 RepID=A0A836LLE0_9TRYP|nr:hypothetical protein JKF63_07306 [Porcisia hertigi]